MSMNVPDRPDPSAQFLSNLDNLDSIKDKAHLYKFSEGRIQERSGLDKLIKSITYKFANPSTQRVQSDVLTNQLAMKVIDHFAEGLVGLNPNQKSDHVISFLNDRVISQLTLPQAQLIRAAVGYVPENKSFMHAEQVGSEIVYTKFDTSEKIRNKLFSSVSKQVSNAESQATMENTRHIAQKRDLEAVHNLHTQLKNASTLPEIEKAMIALYSNDAALPILAKFAEESHNQDGHEFLKAVLDLQATPLDGREAKINDMMEKFIVQDEYDAENPMGIADDSRLPVELEAGIRQPLLEKYESAKSGDIESYAQGNNSQGAYINRGNSAYVPFGAEKIKMQVSDFDTAFKNVIGKLADTIKKDNTIEAELQAKLNELN